MTDDDEQIVRDALTYMPPEEWQRYDLATLALDRLVAERDAAQAERVAAGKFLAQLEAVEAERDRLRAVVERLVYFGEALVAREYEPGSTAVRELVNDAREALRR